MSRRIELADGTVFEVDVDGDRVTVADTRMTVEPLDEHTTRITHHDGRTDVVRLACDRDNLWVAVRARTWVFARTDGDRPRRRTRAIEGERAVTPPMPGQVIQIQIAVGDPVDKGQTVVVVSAMKMETPLKAPYAGEVTAIHTEVGAQVNPGDVLVEIAKGD